VLVAESFEAKGLAKLAEKNLQEALKSLDADDVELTKAVRYQLGRIAESQEQWDSAEEHYNEVAAADYTYRDVAQRLEQLNLKRRSAAR
jgi:hypothetical protein